MFLEMENQTKQGKTMNPKYRYRMDMMKKHFPSSGKLLDVGCGSGTWAKRVGRAFQLVPYGIDVVNGNQEDIEFQVYDGSVLPFADGFFDAALVIHVLHHAHTPERLVGEIARVVRAKGKILILEDMASSRLQNVLTKLSDLYLNRVRNFVMALHGTRKFEMTKVPMTYKIRSYPEWVRTFSRHGLDVLEMRSVSHCYVEHGAFVLQKRGREGFEA